MRLTQVAASAVSIALTLGTGMALAQGQLASTQTPAYSFAEYAPANGYVQDRDDEHRRDQHDEGWDSAPRGYSDIQLRGFRDGIDGAQKDYGNHRNPNPNNRENYKHPHDVPHDLDRDYRNSFREGYQRAWDHLTGHMDRDHHVDHDQDPH